MNPSFEASLPEARARYGFPPALYEALRDLVPPSFPQPTWTPEALGYIAAVHVCMGWPATGAQRRRAARLVRGFKRSSERALEGRACVRAAKTPD